MLLLSLVLLLAATVLLPIGAAGMEDCEWSESRQELLPVLFHAMRFTSCGGTEITQRMVNKTYGGTTGKTHETDHAVKQKQNGWEDIFRTISGK